MKRTAGQGSIILTSSIASIRADITPLQYAASKGALNAMMVSANDRLLADKVRVNCVLPGGVMTNMVMGVAKDLDEQQIDVKVDFDRYPHSEPEEIAAAVTFLASDESSSVKGHSLVVDGGMSQSMSSQWVTKRKPKKAGKGAKL